MANNDVGLIPDPNNVPVVFVNSLAGIGFLNGVVNLTFATARWTPRGSEVLADNVISVRLRMDLFCAQSLHELIGQIIEQHTKGAAQPAPQPETRVN